MLHAPQGILPQRLVLDGVEELDGSVKFGQQAARLEQLQQDDVAHAKAQRREVSFAAADEVDQIVVSSAARNGAELALFVERLEDDAGVVGQPANDVIINLDKLPQAARAQDF